MDDDIDMTPLENVVRAFESRFEAVFEGVPQALCYVGDRLLGAYETLAMGGVHQEGDQFGLFATNIRDLAWAWEKSADDYFNRIDARLSANSPLRRRFLYWRKKPEVSSAWYNDEQIPLMKVRCRLLISDVHRDEELARQSDEPRE